MNFFDIKKKKNAVIFLINCEIIDDYFMTDFEKNINSSDRIGLDMKNVKTIKSFKFIKLLGLNKFKLFNLSSEMLAFIMLISKGGYLKAYVNEQDFNQNKREFIKRKFLIV